jgi:protein-disulfide isomerase
MRPTIVLCAALLLALGACSKGAVSDQEFGEKVRAYLLSHPEVMQEMAQKLNEKAQLAEAQKAKAGIERLRRQIERDPRDFVANPNGKVTVVEFYDYQCGYCKSSAPEVLQLVKDNPDVRFVFKDFVIFGPTSEYAAKAAIAAQSSGRYLDIHRAMMAEKPLSEEAIDRILATNGLDPAKVKAQLDDPAVNQHLQDTHTLAAELGMTGTPAFIIGDTYIPGADMPAVKKAIAAAVKG